MSEFSRNGTLPIPNSEVIQQPLAEGTVLFLPAQEIYYGLNEVGSQIWSLLPPAQATFGELCDVISSRFPDVDRGMIEADVSELLTDLLAQGLAVDPLNVAARRDEVDSAAS